MKCLSYQMQKIKLQSCSKNHLNMKYNGTGKLFPYLKFWKIWRGSKPFGTSTASISHMAHWTNTIPDHVLMVECNSGTSITGRPMLPLWIGSVLDFWWHCQRLSVGKLCNRFRSCIPTSRSQYPSLCTFQLGCWLIVHLLAHLMCYICRNLYMDWIKPLPTGMTYSDSCWKIASWRSQLLILVCS